MAYVNKMAKMALMARLHMAMDSTDIGVYTKIRKNVNLVEVKPIQMSLAQLSPRLSVFKSFLLKESK